ncbi:hypothetical protein [Roseibium aquae]|nr:hypothetical protein [Roseibium aquae]
MAAEAAEPIPQPPRAKPDPNAPVSAAETPIENLLDRPPEPLFSDIPLPFAPASRLGTALTGDQQQGTLYLMAKLTRDSDPLDRGLTWRIYSETTNAEGELELIAKSEGGDAEFRLDPGAYLIHTAFGHATAVNRMVMGREVKAKMVILNAGGIKLDAALDEATPLDGPVTFDIYGMEYDERGERDLIVKDASPGSIIRLSSDTYHIVSRYGDANSVVRADIQVLPGKLTEARVYHKAAEITLKLVNEDGGEAIANTTWSVLSPGGDVVVEAVGAFPSFVLAAGEYEVLARNNDQTFQRKFVVEAGLDREVEVLAKAPEDVLRERTNLPN